MHEVRSIPPAPRRARRAALLAHRWPLAVLGAALVACGSLLAWWMFLQADGKPADQQRLAAEPTATATGKVLAVDAPFRRGDQDWQRTHYRFEPPDGETAGSSLGPAGSHRGGDEVEVEYLLADPYVSRIRGEFLYVALRWYEPGFWLAALVVPGLIVLLGWVAGAFQLRAVLVHGDVSVGRIVAVEVVRRVLPEMLRVTYEFRDHRAVPRRGRHWVRRHGELGERLCAWHPSRRPEPFPVLHDRRFPHWNRILLPTDFLVGPPSDFPQPNQFA